LRISTLRADQLNRFTNLAGYFNSAHEGGRHTFTQDAEYFWCGMLLRKLP
jgi:hypothetical protein